MDGYHACWDSGNSQPAPATGRESRNSDDDTQDLDETNPSSNQLTNTTIAIVKDRYYEGYDWIGACNDALRYGLISQSCITLVTSDGNALTCRGKQIMEAALCPRGQGVIGMLEFIHGPIPDNLESELATACHW